jgi:5'-nucleotidase
MKKKGIYSLVFAGVLLFAIAFLCLCSGKKETKTWFKRVLITNDDGIDSPAIIELARAFNQVAETYVIAPKQNKSGSTHYMSVMRMGALKVEKRNLGEGIQAYSVDGYPADCVLIALGGIMLDNPPDLVISGINNGPNLGEAWIGSGTIGAARVASFGGFPAIAVSGVDDDTPGALEAASRWIVRLAQSPLFQGLGKNQFLTVDIPNVPPQGIQGIRLAKRAGLYQMPIFAKSDTGEQTEGNGQELWRMTERREMGGVLPDDSDIALYEKGYIVIVPMKADEHDYDLLAELEQDLSLLPPY